MGKEITCPICGKRFLFIRNPGEPLPPGFPFCSPRCRMVDLGRWMDGDYLISREAQPEDYLENPEEEVSDSLS